MADYFKPRRGTLASATNKLVGENALRTGELFFELEYKEGTKEVKSGKIKLGGDGKDYANLNYVFDPDAYLELTDTFKVDPSSSSDISTNIGTINSTNTNITEKFGATSKALSLLNTELEKKPNKSDVTYVIEKGIMEGTSGNATSFKYSNGSTYTTATYDASRINYQKGDSRRAAESIYAVNASTANYATKAKYDDYNNEIREYYINSTTVPYIESITNPRPDSEAGTSIIYFNYTDGIPLYIKIPTNSATDTYNILRKSVKNAASAVFSFESENADRFKAALSLLGEEEIEYHTYLQFNENVAGTIFENYKNKKAFDPNRTDKLVIINGALYDSNNTIKKRFYSVFMLAFSPYEYIQDVPSGNIYCSILMPLDNHTYGGAQGDIDEYPLTTQVLYPLYDDNDIGQKLYILYKIDTSTSSTDPTHHGKSSLEIKLQGLSNYTGKAQCMMFDFHVPYIM